MTMVRVKVSGYIMVPSYETDDILAQEQAADQVEDMLSDFELENAEVCDTEIVSYTQEPTADEDALYEERRNRHWRDMA